MFRLSRWTSLVFRFAVRVVNLQRARLLLHRVPDSERTDARPDRGQIGRYAITSAFRTRIKRCATGRHEPLACPDPAGHPPPLMTASTPARMPFHFEASVVLPTSRVTWCVSGAASGWRDTNMHSCPSADSLAWIADPTSPVPPTRRMRTDRSFDRRPRHRKPLIKFLKVRTTKAGADAIISQGGTDELAAGSACPSKDRISGNDDACH